MVIWEATTVTGRHRRIMFSSAEETIGYVHLHINHKNMTVAKQYIIKS